MTARLPDGVRPSDVDPKAGDEVERLLGEIIKLMGEMADHAVDGRPDIGRKGGMGADPETVGGWLHMLTGVANNVADTGRAHAQVTRRLWRLQKETVAAVAELRAEVVKLGGNPKTVSQAATNPSQPDASLERCVVAIEVAAAALTRRAAK
jgi:hypothetical protein